jgi:hypothetical protein
MQNLKFVVKVNRGGTRAPEYVQRVDPTPIHMTTNRKLALVMGKFTDEDAITSLIAVGIPLGVVPPARTRTGAD